MGNFEFRQMSIRGVFEIQPRVFGDERGYFLETYQIGPFAEAGINRPFVQDNESFSRRGVLRGLHFQKQHTQGKLVRVTSGRVFDVAVDCRPNSATFGRWEGIVLDSEKKNMFYLPEGIAHGFLVLSETAQFTCKCTDIYDPSSEGGIPWDDPSVHVEWPKLDIPYVTSAKDKEHLPFDQQTFTFFEQY